MNCLLVYCTFQCGTPTRDIHLSKEVQHLNKNVENFRYCKRHHRKTEQLQVDFQWCICFVLFDFVLLLSSCFPALTIPQMDVHQCIILSYILIFRPTSNHPLSLCPNNYKVFFFLFFCPLPFFRDHLSYDCPQIWIIMWSMAKHGHYDLVRVVRWIILKYICILDYIEIYWIILKRLNPSDGVCHSWKLPDIVRLPIDPIIRLNFTLVESNFSCKNTVLDNVWDEWSLDNCNCDLLFNIIYVPKPTQKSNPLQL